ncbi:MAG: FecR family protein [Sphingobacterium sp.]
MENSQEIVLIIKKYIAGEITAEESRRLGQWLEKSPANQRFFDHCLDQDKVYADLQLWKDLTDPEKQSWFQETKARTFQSIRQSNPLSSRRTYWPWIGVAATVLLCLGIFLFMQQDAPEFEQEISATNFYRPEKDAELILSNGQKINLRSDQNEIIFNGNLKYADGTAITALKIDELETLHATIIVPQGGQYQVQLNDGTEIWLNSMSRLDYPLKFNTDKRAVNLQGEGYFKVAAASYAGQSVPFEVHTDQQTIRVTGTEFNLSAYHDNPEVVTTLVEGSVEVSSKFGTVSLQPNEQSALGKTGIQKKNIEIDQYVAWRANKFMFFETELREVMKMLSRWYAIQVTYQPGIPETYFYGQIAKDKDLGSVLSILENSGLKFKFKQDQKNYRLQVIQ